MNPWKRQRMMRQFSENLSVTNIFLLIQVILFLLMTLFGGSTNGYVLILFGAKYTPLIMAGQYWRLFAPIFLHIGITHLVMNSVLLYFLGNEIERIIGSWRFTIVYIMSGFLGNLASYAFSPSLSAGASTSLFGLFGVILYLSRKHSYNRTFYQLGRSYGVLIAMNIIFGFLNSGVDNWGHMGGLLGGYLMGTIVSFRGDRLTPLWTKVLAFLGFVGISVLCYYLPFLF